MHLTFLCTYNLGQRSFGYTSLGYLLCCCFFSKLLVYNVSWLSSYEHFDLSKLGSSAAVCYYFLKITVLRLQIMNEDLPMKPQTLNLVYNLLVQINDVSRRYWLSERFCRIGRLIQISEG